MKMTYRSFKYGDAWLVTWSDGKFVEIPNIPDESEQGRQRRAIAALNTVVGNS